MEPGALSGPGAEAYTMDGGDPAFDAEDARRLADLVRRLPAELGPRVRIARRHFEFAQRTMQDDVRFSVLCTAAEALTTTKYGNTEAQFRSGVAALAKKVGNRQTDEVISAMYDTRSKIAHGQEPITAEMEKARPLEAILRETLYWCIADAKFRDVFDDDLLIQQKKWPGIADMVPTRDRRIAASRFENEGRA